MQKTPGLGAQATQLRPLWRLKWVEGNFRQFGGETLILFQANLPANQERRILLLEHGLSRKLSILFVTGMSSAMLMVCLSKCFLYCFHSQGQLISTLAPCWASMPARFSWLVLMTRPTSSFKLSGIICTHSTPPQALCYMEEHPDQFAVANAAWWQDFPFVLRDTWPRCKVQLALQKIQSLTSWLQKRDGIISGLDLRNMTWCIKVLEDAIRVFQEHLENDSSWCILTCV